MININPVKTVKYYNSYASTYKISSFKSCNTHPEFSGIPAKPGFIASVIAGVLVTCGTFFINSYNHYRNEPVQKEIAPKRQKLLNLLENRFRASELAFNMEIVEPLLKNIKDNLKNFDKLDKNLKLKFLRQMTKLDHANKLLKESGLTPKTIESLNDTKPSSKQIRALRYYTITLLKANALCYKIDQANIGLIKNLIETATNHYKNKLEHKKPIIEDHHKSLFALKHEIAKNNGQFKTIWRIPTDYLNLHTLGSLFSL